jgi:23S rRNA pseudouridine1911/1915/1917 synthase
MQFLTGSTRKYFRPMILPRIINLTVDDREQESRIDKFLHQKFPQYSRSFWQKLIDQKALTVNGNPVKASHKISTGEKIQIDLPEAKEVKITPENIDLDIVYEDSDIVVINKPPGLVVHPGAGVHSGTLVNALLYHCKDLSGIGGQLRPGIVHRLDKNTSGLMIAAKNDRAHYQLARQLASKTMIRKYKAIVWFPLSVDSGRIETFLNRSKRNRKIFVVAETGKKAITHYNVLKNYVFLSLLELQLETGRTHQIRSHLNHIHHPVFGDPDYNGRLKQINQLQNKADKMLAKQLLSEISRQALHSAEIRFKHPTDNRVYFFHSDLPGDMALIIDQLDNEFAEN